MEIFNLIQEIREAGLAEGEFDIENGKFKIALRNDSICELMRVCK